MLLYWLINRCSIASVNSVIFSLHFYWHLLRSTQFLFWIGFSKSIWYRLRTQSLLVYVSVLLAFIRIDWNVLNLTESNRSIQMLWKQVKRRLKILVNLSWVSFLLQFNHILVLHQFHCIDVIDVNFSAYFKLKTIDKFININRIDAMKLMHG